VPEGTGHGKQERADGKVVVQPWRPDGFRQRAVRVVRRTTPSAAKGSVGGLSRG